jgi:NADH-quinone oxidoreductase subunit E
MSWKPSEAGQQHLDAIVARYPSKMAACLPALRLAQEEIGWVTPEAMTWVAERLEVPLAHVQGVVSFYTLYHREPVGKHVVQVCRTLSCALMGGEKLLARCEAKLGIKAGGTTPDGRITLQTAECLASCGTAPALTVDDEFHEDVTIAKLDGLLDRLRG